MSTIKSFEEIYNDLIQKFYERTNIDIEPRTIIDMFFKAISDSMATIYQVIEDNKKPYLFTRQEGEELDDTGYFLNCPRLDGETDENYLYRLSNWIQRNATSNQTAIEDITKELLYSSSANYIPYTHGIGTATVYLIPLDYSKESRDRAINEARQKLSTVVSPTSIIYYKVAEPSLIKLVAYLDVKEGYDVDVIKKQIHDALIKYINGIAPGEYMYLGTINKLGLEVQGVEYFNILQLFNNDEELADFELLQTIQAKYLLNEIIWWDVEG